jgi:hypothetical protein
MPLSAEHKELRGCRVEIMSNARDELNERGFCPELRCNEYSHDGMSRSQGSAPLGQRPPYHGETQLRHFDVDSDMTNHSTQISDGYTITQKLKSPKPSS